MGEIREFLAARSSAPLPDTVGRLLADVADRCARVHDRGLARLIECAEPALAALIANDTRTRTDCMRAGERHLVVLAAEQMAEALREHARYVVPPNVEQEILELAARYGRVVIRGPSVHRAPRWTWRSSSRAASSARRPRDLRDARATLESLEHTRPGPS